MNKEQTLNKIKILLNQIQYEHKLHDINKNLFFEIFLYLLEISDENLIKLITSKFENSEIYTDLVSTIYNENCSCRTRVQEFFLYNFFRIKDNFIDIFSNEIVSIDILNVILEKINEYIENYQNITENKLIVKIGDVIEINNNDKEYQDLLTRIEKDNMSFFRGIQIIPIKNKLKLYFY